MITRKAGLLKERPCIKTQINSWALGSTCSTFVARKSWPAQKTDWVWVNRAKTETGTDALCFSNIAAESLHSNRNLFEVKTLDDCRPKAKFLARFPVD